MAIAGSLVVTVQARTDQFEQGMQRTRRSLAETQQAVTRAQVSFTGLGASLTALGASAVSLVAISNGIRDVVQSGRELQQLRNSFAAITGSVSSGQETFAFIQRTANQLGLDLQSLAEQFRGLAAATRGTRLEGQSTRDLFVALSRASAAYGLSTEQTGRALTAFQQIISKGKVSQEELRGQLGEALPGANQIAARAFGVTTQQLDAMIAKGLDGIEFAKAMTRQLGVEVPAATNQSTAGFTRLGNEILALKDRIAQSGLLEFLNNAAGSLANLLNRATEFNAKVQQIVRNRLGDLANVATPEELKDLELFQRLVEKSDGQNQIANQSFQRLQETLRARQRFNQLAAGDLAEEQQLRFPLEQREAATDRLNKAKQILTEFRTDLQRINREAALTPTLFDKNREAIKAAEERAKELRAVFAGQGSIPDEVRKSFAEITSTATNAQNAIDAAAKAKQVATKAERDAATAARQAAREAEAVRERLLRQEEQYIRSLQDELTLLGLGREELEKQELIKKTVTEHGRETARLALEELQARREFQALLEESEARVQGARDDIGAAAARQRKDVAKETARAEIAGLRETQREIERWGDSITDVILSVTDIGKRSWADFADSILRDIQRILAQQYLRPALSGLIQTGLNAALSLFGGYAAAQGAFTAPAVQGSGTIQDAGIAFGERQQGGPVMGPGFYRVGEAGEEILALSKGQQGHVFRHGEMPTSNVVVNFTVNTPDTGSFQRDRANIERNLLRMLQRGRGI